MIILRTKTPSESNAVDIIKELIKADISAGGSIYKTKEVYQWGNTIREDDMFTVELVTNPDNIEVVTQIVKKLNDDKEPSVVMMGIIGDNFTEQQALQNGNMEVTGKIYG